MSQKARDFYSSQEEIGKKASFRAAKKLDAGSKLYFRNCEDSGAIKLIYLASTFVEVTLVSCTLSLRQSESVLTINPF